MAARCSRLERTTILETEQQPSEAGLLTADPSISLPR